MSYWKNEIREFASQASINRHDVDSFVAGMICAVRGFAVYRNGRQEIGSPEQDVSYVIPTLKKAGEEIIEEFQL